MAFIGRIGLFFLFISLILLILFFVSGQAEDMQCGYFLAALILGVFGYSLMRRGAQPRQPSDRFRILRRLGKKQKEDSRRDSG